MRPRAVAVAQLRQVRPVPRPPPQSERHAMEPGLRWLGSGGWGKSRADVDPVASGPNGADTRRSGSSLMVRTSTLVSCLWDRSGGGGTHLV